MTREKEPAQTEAGQGWSWNSKRVMGSAYIDVLEGTSDTWDESLNRYKVGV